MKTNDLRNAIETLRVQNGNGRYDEVINQLEVQFQELFKEEEEKRIEEDWGLTKPQYDDVMKEVSATCNPTDDAFKFNNKQMRLFAYMFVSRKILVKDYEGDIITCDDARKMVYDDPFNYIDIDEIVDEKFDEVDEEELYDILVELRDDEYVTDEDGNVINEEDEVVRN